MTRHTRAWAGGAIAVVAAAVLGGHFVVVGLDNADKLASVIGVFVALAGLGVAAHGLVTGRRTGPQMPPQVPTEGQSAITAGSCHNESGRARAEDRPPDVRLRAKASGKGRVYQAGRDQTIHER